MNVSVAYIAASTNRHSSAADVFESLVAFGSSNLVCIWSLDDDHWGITESLTGHEGLVTCVRFVSKDSFISADDKGVLFYWKRKGSQWTPVTFQAHDKPISSLCVYEDCLATGSSDSSVKIWALKDSDITEVQSLSLRGRYPFAIALSRLPRSKSLILAIGGTDKTIDLWTRSDGSNFVHSVTLSGHEDWIRSLSFLPPTTETEPLILASGSQDATIRLWNIETYSREQESSAVDVDELLDAFEASLGDPVEGEEGGRQISLKRHILTVKSDEGSLKFSVTFDALLIGHEAGVTCLSWKAADSASSIPTLLSTSIDSSLILWSPSTIISGSSEDTSTALWINRRRFGDVGGQRYGGFVGGLWVKAGSQAMAWGWSGGWRSWRCDSIEGDEIWSEVGAIGGHRGPVKDIAWCPNGDYLISTGVDQTARIHAPVPGPNGSTWHELARPQVHGYDLQGVAFTKPLQFVSIADEKVARVFEAPRAFVTLLETLKVSEFNDEEHDRPDGATVPPLGLSNKASNEVTNEELMSHSRRPFEGELASITLWPEIEKIFGHGYESISIAVSKSRQLIATACRATTAEHAVIRLYDTEKWQLVGEPLEGHSLTVTRIAFSPDDQHVLSGSRDRSWRLFTVQEDGGYKPTYSDKSHGRIIWDCDWTHEGDLFATASRDKTVRIWGQSDSKWTAMTTIKTKEPATAVNFSKEDEQRRRHLAIGLENGEIVVYSNNQGNWSQCLAYKAHTDHIQRLAWRPGGLQLASCSEDGTIKISNIVLP